MGFLEEFRQFAIKGNAIDMAVGLVVGAAFNKIVNSIVSDLLMPPLGVLIGGVDFNDLQVVIQEAVKENGKEITAKVAIRYGRLPQHVHRVRHRRLQRVRGGEGHEQADLPAGHARGGGGTQALSGRSSPQRPMIGHLVQTDLEQLIQAQDWESLRQILAAADGPGRGGAAHRPAGA